MFGTYNGFVSKARVSACMYFLVLLKETNKPVYICDALSSCDEIFA
jgi:hypothetical protein